MEPLKGIVYVAGPMTLGVREDNICNAMKAGSELLDAGWCAFLPQLSFFWDDQFPHTWEQWLSYDFTIIEKCDAIIRLPGESRGADAETKLATEIGVPIYASVQAFLQDQ